MLSHIRGRTRIFPLPFSLKVPLWLIFAGSTRLIGLNDTLHNWESNDLLRCKADETHAFYVLEQFDRLLQT